MRTFNWIQQGGGGSCWTEADHRRAFVRHTGAGLFRVSVEGAGQIGCDLRGFHEAERVFAEWLESNPFTPAANRGAYLAALMGE